MRGVWIAMLVFGLVLLGVGVAFLLSGPEAVVLTVLFGGGGAFLTLEALGHLFERRR